MSERRAPSEDGDGAPPHNQPDNGITLDVLTEKRPPSQAKADFSRLSIAK